MFVFARLVLFEYAPVFWLTRFLFGFVCLAHCNAITITLGGSASTLQDIGGMGLTLWVEYIIYSGNKHFQYKIKVFTIY